MKAGERAGAILSIENGVAEFLGYGEYLGRQVPDDPNIQIMGINMKERGIENPCIKLDSGEKVYGCQCWWGPEDQIKAVLSKCKEVKHVSLAAAMTEATKADVGK